MRLPIQIALIIAVALSACGRTDSRGTAWGDGSFDTNGERIYYTATSDRNDDIDYEGGPDLGGMMMGGQLSCASCHGPDARGGRHQMHMETMDAPSIRWPDLTGEANDHGDIADDEEAGHAESYGLATFRGAVVDGVHPDGDPLSEDMPRWALSDADLRDLFAFLQSLDTP